MSPSLSQAIELSGATRDVINKWMERGVLGTPVAPTPNGVAREFSRANLLEIAFVAELSRAGVEARVAAVHANDWIEQEGRGVLKRRWALNPRTGETHPFDAYPQADDVIDAVASYIENTEEAGGSGPGRDEDNWPAASLVIIDRAEIVRRVDRMVAAGSGSR